MFGACATYGTSESTPSLNHSGGQIRHCVRQYAPDASIVLIGFSRAGKKTLGIIASVSLRRRLVDFAATFQEQFKLPPREYILAHGLGHYRTVEDQLTRQLLSTCQRGCVIVGLGDVAGQQTQTLLTNFGEDHPVIYIRRDRTALHQLMSTADDKIERFYQVGNTFYESASNFEFFNLEESRQGDRQPPSSLKLKDTERVFVQFLNRIFGRPASSMLSSNWASDSKTFILQLPASWPGEGEDLELLDAGADGISLVVDVDEQDEDDLQCRLARHVAILRMHFRGPVLIDVNSANSQIPVADEVFDRLIRVAPDAITCPLNCDPDVINALNKFRGTTKVMATYRRPAPLGWDSRLSELSALPQKASGLGFDYIRITGESSDAEDNLGCIALRHNIASTSTIPVAMYNTGILGRTSVCLNPTMSPIVLPDTLSVGVTLVEAQKALTACFLLHRKVFTAVGQAVEGTLSPSMHNAAYTCCGLPHTYDYMQIPSITQIRPIFDDEAHGGVAVSLPYKSAIISYLDDIDSDAKNINAVNTIVLDRHHRPNGTYETISKGYNTDYIGVKNCVHKHLSPANAIRDGTTALIIGAGGMARAAIYGCYQLGVRRICVYNRTADNAIALAAYYNSWAKGTQSTDFHVEVIPSLKAPWPAQFRLPTIVVACVPAKQVNSDALINVRVPEEWLGSRTGGVFLEVAYGPSRTPLLEQMLHHRSRGWVVVGGLNLLIEQGIAQYELFTKRPAPVHVMRRTIQELAGQYVAISSAKDNPDDVIGEDIEFPPTHIHLCLLLEYVSSLNIQYSSEKLNKPTRMTYQPSIMSASLGRAWIHALPHKINQASLAGFKGIEIFYEDLEYFARDIGGIKDTETVPTPDQLLNAASQIKTLCDEGGLEIIDLQPFLFYDGLKDREQHDQLIKKLKLWFRLAKTLGTTTIQVPANFLPPDRLADDVETIVSDLREIADMGAKEDPPIRFAYENLCWSTKIDTVQKLWEVVKRVDRPNFGMCLDTFNIAGRVWADPASPTGKTEDAEEALDAAIKMITEEIDKKKVFFIQVVDAERLEKPLVEGHEFYVESQPARMSWSRNARTFMYEEDRGAYLPVEKVARAIIEGLQYKGWVSMELFSRTMNEEGEHVPGEHARRGIASWKKLQERLSLQ
ncbi:hypothetical protein BDW69DRAFT_184423 [Aspergillus filifer]